MMNILWAVVSLSVMGLLFGAGLALASKVFAVEVDERVPQIVEVLPGANCGGCGFAGCGAYADAVVNHGAKLNGCPVGGAAVAQKVAAIMGQEAAEGEKSVARVLCSGSALNAKEKYVYSGISDCLSVLRLGGGAKECGFGCIGLGSCAAACPFDAISMVDGLAVVNREKCVACGVCVSTCPKHIISLIPASASVFVDCMSKDKGLVAKNACEVACIGCKICEKVCPSAAITVADNKASIDYSKCTQCGACVEKCPRHCITLLK